MYTPFNLSGPDGWPLVMAAIGRRLEPDAVFIFAHHHTLVNSGCAIWVGNSTAAFHHYHLLVLAKSFPPNCIADIAFCVNEQSQGQCHVTVVCVQTQHIHALPLHRAHFIGSILQNGMLAYCRPGFTLQPPVIPPFDFAAAKKYWLRRKYFAICFTEAEVAIENPNADAVQATMLCQAVEHLSLGLVALFLGHRPQQYHLGYLLDLCLCFTSLPGEIFPRTTQEDMRLFAILSANAQSLRKKPKVTPCITDIELLRSRVRVFMDHAVAIAEKRLSEGLSNEKKQDDGNN